MAIAPAACTASGKLVRCEARNLAALAAMSAFSCTLPRIQNGSITLGKRFVAGLQRSVRLSNRPSFLHSQFRSLFSD
jgi:hypothetical protein